MVYGEQDSPIARLYDGDYATARAPSGDIEFYLEEAREAGGPVLELGCGTGRVLGTIAAAGIEIVGLDASAPMLAQARAKFPDVELVAGDMRDFDLDRRFALVTIPFRAIAHIEESAGHVALFRCVRRHLASGGRLVFDHFHPNPAMLCDPVPETLQFEREEAGRRIRRYFRSIPHRSRQLSEIWFRWEIESEDGSIEHLSEEFTMRWFYRFELEHLLARCGLAVDAVYGDFDRSALADDSREMIFRAKPEDAAGV